MEGMEKMSFDMNSYIMGYENGSSDGEGNVVIEGGITCTDANNDGNIVITEDN